MTPRPLLADAAQRRVRVLDQTLLPTEERWVPLDTVAGVAQAITTMQVRGAPLIGVTAAYGVAIGMHADPADAALDHALVALSGTRPTAVNLRWALDRMARVVRPLPPSARGDAAWAEATAIADEDVTTCRAIGDHGLGLLRSLAGAGSRPLQVMTHCNAGWLATLEYGTALAPVYRAMEVGLPVHVWVSETRPRSQGWLTAWELERAGVPFTVIADNAAGHLLQRGEVDIVIVGTDRTTRMGDLCNKIGTMLKALAAREAGVPFHAAVPSSSIDWSLRDWRDIPIESRSVEELTPRPVPGCNPAFDVTPAPLVTGLITERGCCAATEAGLHSLFPEVR